MILEPRPFKKDKEETVAAEIRRQKFLFSDRIRPGQKLYSLDPDTKKVEEIEIKWDIVVNKKGNPVRKSKVVFEKDKKYLTAINMKNAIRKFKKIGLLPV